ncbi:MAG: hypothetical protein K0S63_762 [Gammaproteobacteria bacterium]|nr:hypothetical protein [Gammaproteobacteria bacterium]
MQLSHQRSQNNLFRYLLLLTTFFVFFEISLFSHSSGFYLGDFKLVSDHLKIPIHKIFPSLAYFLFVQLMLHLLFTMFIWSVASLMSIALRSSPQKTEKLGLILWVIGITTILLANQHFYPDSKFALLISSLLPQQIADLAFTAMMIILGIAVLFSMAGLKMILMQRKKIMVSGLICVSIAIIGYIQYAWAPVAIADAATSSRPNIILIGVDSLRPDFLGYFGDNQRTPAMDDFLNHAAVFSEALTPLARTYPSWVSILTGVYPKKDAVRFNLSESISFNLKETLPAILQQHGYKTIFATDETRFSNVDQHFGFDKVVTPPIGFNDFLVGTLNDFPFSNLLVNTPLGRYLFPFSYGNRPAFVTYNPDSFLKLLQPVLSESRHQPLFLAVHFCLPHYPYLWAGRPSNTTSFHNYQNAVYRADQQVSDFLKILKRNELLEKSIVVLLSDHGEALELRGDRITEPALFMPSVKNVKRIIPRFYPPTFSTERVNQSAGHGTDVLGLSQYHIVLAFRFFGIPAQRVALMPGIVSLLDIKPTVLNLLSIASQKGDGKSLRHLIAGKKMNGLEKPDFFIESDFSPEAVRSVHPETHAVLFEGVKFFQINPDTTRLTIRHSMVDLILSSKQYADFHGSWVLALYPQTVHQMMPILVNLKSGEWTNDLRTAFAQQAPAKEMLSALKRFYGADITSIKNIS